MSDPQLDAWLAARRTRRPLAASLPRLDGFVTVVTAGPVFMNP